MDERIERRAHLHGALADATRLAIVDELHRSDRSPTELAGLLSIPGNLLAHHLDTLEEAGFIERIVSSGDRRRRYVRLIPAPLTELAVATAPLPDRVLFVCTHNSARSQLAAALWRHRTGGHADSAGTHPARRVHPGAVAAARRAGLDIEGATPKQFDPGPRPDLVVTVCDRAREELHPGPSWRHWSIADPVEVGTAQAFDAALSEIEGRVRLLAGDGSP